MKKKGILIALACFVLAALGVFIGLYSGMLGGEGTGNSLKIGIFNYRGDDTFISTLNLALQEIAAEYEESADGARIYLNAVDAEGRQSIQNEQIDRYLSLDYDVLCVNLVDRTHAATVIDKAMEKNVPIVFFNREPVEADMNRWNQLYYVGTDAPMNGQLEGEIVVEAYRENPERFDKNGDGVIQYIMLEGEFRHQDAVLRTEGSVQTIRDAGIGMEKLDGGVANWERSQAAALARTYFEAYGEQIELIICNNDDMALGVIDAVEELGNGFTNIVGIDGTPQGLAAVEDGKMIGTVVIDAAAQADMVFRLALALGTGESVSLDEIADAVMAGENAPAYVLTEDPRTIRAGMYITTG